MKSLLSALPYLAAWVASQDPGSGLEFSASALANTVVLGQDFQIEVTLRNVSDKPVDVTPLAFDQRSVFFSIFVESEPGKSVTYDYSALQGSAHAVEAPPMDQVTLGPGKSLISVFRIPAILPGAIRITARYVGGGRSLIAKDIDGTVKVDNGRSKLGFEIEFQAGEKTHRVTGLLYPDLAPSSVSHFAALARRNFYKNLKIVHVVKDNWFRSGCPNNDGFGDAGFVHRAENENQKRIKGDLVFEAGTLAFSQVQKLGWQSSQFFITQRRISYLDHKFTILGRVDPGPDSTNPYETLHNIAIDAHADATTEKPTSDVTIRALRIVTR